MSLSLSLLEPGPSAAGLLAAYAQGFAILALGVAGAVAARHRPAARCTLLLLALAGGTAGPLLDAMLPDLRVAVLAPTARAGAALSSSPAAAPAPPVDQLTAASTAGVAHRAVSATTPSGRSQGHSVDLVGAVATWLPVLLATGAALSFALFAAQLLALRRLARDATPITDAAWAHDLADARARLGLDRAVRLVSHSELAVPLTWGLVRPVIAVPTAAASWCGERRLAVLLHELAHVRRLDWPALLLARLVRGVYWANPLAWWATARLIQAQELACDRLVVEHGLRPSAYAGHLLHIARDARSLPIAAAALAAARSSDVEVRVMSILEPTSSATARRRIGGSASFALTLLVVGATVALATLEPGPRAGRPPVPPLPPLGAAHAAPAALPPTATALTTRPLPPLQPAAALRPQPPPPRATAVAAEPVEDGGEVGGDLRSLAGELGALHDRLAPFEQELRLVEAKLRPFEEQLRAIEGEARVHELAMREVEREMSGAQRALELDVRSALEPHEQRLAELQETIRPIEEQIRSVERELAPLQREIEQRGRLLAARGREIDEELERELETLHERMEPIHERLEALHRELEPRFAEIERVHDEMAPVHQRMEAAHRQLEPVHDRLEAIHQQLEPIHERMEAVHQQMEPVHEELERIHEQMEPLHRELEKTHRRVERALRGELRELLARELGAGVSGPALDAATTRIAEILDVNVTNGWLRVRGSAPELRDQIARALRAEGGTADAARIAAAADAVLELEVRIPTGRE